MIILKYTLNNHFPKDILKIDQLQHYGQIKTLL